MAFSGIDIRKSGGLLVFRAFLQDGSSPIELVTSGTTLLQLLELQADGTLKAYDFSNNTFTAGALGDPNTSMTHQNFNGESTASGIWTYVLATVSGFTAGSIYFAQIENSAAVPPLQTREFQYGLAEGDLAVNTGDGGVTLHSYATGEDPATLLATPLGAIQAQTDLIGANGMDSPNTASAQANVAIAASQATTAATLSVTAVSNTATLLTNLAAVEGHAVNADSQSATAATQAASAATAATTAAAQAASAATALGTAGSGLTNLPPVSLTSAYNLYLADVNFTKSSTTSTDDYTVVWSKNGIVVNSGITDAAIQVNNQDGSTLLAQTGMAGPNSGIFYHNETTNRTTAGAPVDVVVTATIDGLTRTYSRTVGRDA